MFVEHERFQTPVDPLRTFHETWCVAGIEQNGSLHSLGNFEQGGHDPACVQGPDLLDYLRRDTAVAAGLHLLAAGLVAVGCQVK